MYLFRGEMTALPVHFHMQSRERFEGTDTWNNNGHYSKRFVKALWYRIPAQRSPASLNVQLQWQKAMSLDVHRYYWTSSCGGSKYSYHKV